MRIIVPYCRLFSVESLLLNDLVSCRGPFRRPSPPVSLCSSSYSRGPRPICSTYRPLPIHEGSGPSLTCGPAPSDTNVGEGGVAGAGSPLGPPEVVRPARGGYDQSTPSPRSALLRQRRLSERRVPKPSVHGGRLGWAGSADGDPASRRPECRRRWRSRFNSPTSRPSRPARGHGVGRADGGAGLEGRHRRSKARVVTSRGSTGCSFHVCTMDAEPRAGQGGVVTAGEAVLVSRSQIRRPQPWAYIPAVGRAPRPVSPRDADPPPRRRLPCRRRTRPSAGPSSPDPPPSPACSLSACRSPPMTVPDSVAFRPRCSEKRSRRPAKLSSTSVAGDAVTRADATCNHTREQSMCPSCLKHITAGKVIWVDVRL